MIRSYKGITPTIPSSCYVDESAQLIGDVTAGRERQRLDEHSAARRRALHSGRR